MVHGYAVGGKGDVVLGSIVIHWRHIQSVAHIPPGESVSVKWTPLFSVIDNARNA
jgi:hypothetical protein